ncbi:MAG: hypothetical protein ACK44D_09585 [Bacteroidia bacterium]
MYKAICLFRDQYAHIKPVEDALKDSVSFEYLEEWTTEKIKDSKPDIIIGINEFHPEVAYCYELAQSLNIPTLTLQDGILEWRFMFENPIYEGNSKGAPLHFPVLADKYACISPFYAHIIQCLGNEGRVEVTGMPKMDKLPILPYSPDKTPNKKKRVMVITATKPWFKDEQESVVHQMLLDLKLYFESRPDIEPVWRVTKLLFRDIDVKTTYNAKESKEIVEQIMSCDAVISMPSTAIIEAMRCGKPVAQIDYFNVPNMVNTSWKISCKSQIEQTISELLNPEPFKMWMQDTCHHLMCVKDNLAAERVSELILKMVNHSKENPGKPMPDFLLDPVFYQNRNMPLQPKHMFLKRETLQHTDDTWLRAKLLRLELQNQTLKAKLDKRTLSSILIGLYSRVIAQIIKRKKNEK